MLENVVKQLPLELLELVLEQLGLYLVVAVVVVLEVPVYQQQQLDVLEVVLVL